MLSSAWHDNERNQHDIMPNGFCMWHDGGMTGSMTVRLSCHSQADTKLDRQSHLLIMGGGMLSN